MKMQIKFNKRKSYTVHDFCGIISFRAKFIGYAAEFCDGESLYIEDGGRNGYIFKKKKSKYNPEGYCIVKPVISQDVNSFSVDLIAYGYGHYIKEIRWYNHEKWRNTYFELTNEVIDE